MAAVRLATPETDAEVAEDAQRMTVHALELAVRRERDVTPAEEGEARQERGVWFTTTRGGTMLRMRGQFPVEEGERIASALEREAAALPREDEDGFIPLHQRTADALAALARERIAQDADPDRANILVHVDLETLRTGVGSGWTDRGGLLSAATISKLLCDARLQALVENEEGKPLGVGRTMRTAPQWMRRAAKARDKTCCFPGCDQTRFLVPHHIDEWTADQGPTDLENLPLLCPFHHRLVHTTDWHIEGNPYVGLTFIGPTGPVRNAPPPLDYDVKKWLWEDLYKPSTSYLFGSSCQRE